MLQCRSPHNVDNSARTSLSASSSRSNSKLRPSCKIACRIPALTAPCHRGSGHRRGRCSAPCRRAVASAEQYDIPPPPGVQDAERIPWQDSSTDVAFIGMCRKAYGKLAGWQSDADWKDGVESYRGMIEVSRALMRGKTAEQQRDAVIAGFPQVPAWFRRVFPATRWGAKLNARITPAFFSWLVGPMEPIDVEVDGVMQRSGVHIRRCRYLAESGCAGMCVNLCKTPTQSFFTEQLGMPLTMEPDFETYECTMSFGKRPPPVADDEVAQQPCLAGCASALSSSSASQPCHKLQ